MWSDDSDDTFLSLATQVEATATQTRTGINSAPKVGTDTTDVTSGQDVTGAPIVGTDTTEVPSGQDVTGAPIVGTDTTEVPSGQDVTVAPIVGTDTTEVPSGQDVTFAPIVGTDTTDVTSGQDVTGAPIVGTDTTEVPSGQDVTGAPKVGTDTTEVPSGQDVTRAPKVGTDTTEVPSGQDVTGAPKVGTDTTQVPSGQDVTGAPKVGTDTTQVPSGQDVTSVPKVGTDTTAGTTRIDITYALTDKSEVNLESDKDVFLQETTEHSKRKNRKRKPTRKKLRYVSSSDDDVPLSFYIKLHTQDHGSGSDTSFVPKSKDRNPSDTEYSSDLSATSKKQKQDDELLKRKWERSVRGLKKKKEKRKTRRERKKCVNQEESMASEASALNAIKRTSYHEHTMRKSLITANEGRLDRLLSIHGLKRKTVPQHGNCFFQAACHSDIISESDTQLRQSLCNHLEDNALEYMGFLLNKFSPTKEEEFITDYLLEIDNLKHDGYYSNKVADFLPLALANYASCSVTIYTSKPDQTQLEVSPTLAQSDGKRNITLAYLTIPNILEHYDACVEVHDEDEGQFRATPMPSANSGDQESCPNISSMDADNATPNTPCPHNSSMDADNATPNTPCKRGSNEISSCLNLYLSSLDSGVEHVILYSDACTGQNRNQIVATCLLHAVTAVPHIKTIDHKFLESGHTHMECDSMHAAIEFAKSKTKIFVPSQWETVISMARRKEPYHVVTMKYFDFKDFKEMKSKAPTPSKADIGKKPKWKSIKWMQFRKEDPELCFFKYEVDETNEFQKVKLISKLSSQPQPLYKGKIPISSAKKKDLVTMCKQGVVPSEYQEYYKGLPASQNVKERLPEPDRDESSDDTDIE